MSQAIKTTKIVQFYDQFEIPHQFANNISRKITIVQRIDIENGNNMVTMVLVQNIYTV